MSQAPTTELEAVNFLLATIGESPVNSLEVPNNLDAVQARARIREVSRNTQNKGWFWNTDERFPLPADINGEIILPTNALRVYTVYPDGDLDLVVRGNRLYDRKNHTFNIGRTIKVDLVRFLAFEQIPEAARWYITVTAGRMFQEKSLGSESLAKFTRDDERRAWADLLYEEAETGKYNVFRDSGFAAEVTWR